MHSARALTSDREAVNLRALDLHQDARLEDGHVVELVRLVRPVVLFPPHSLETELDQGPDADLVREAGPRSNQANAQTAPEGASQRSVLSAPGPSRIRSERDRTNRFDIWFFSDHPVLLFR